eukprot:gene14693-17360_t
MSAEPLRWGILGTGRIANDFAAALRTLPDANLVAVAARTLSSAKNFAEKHAVSRAYGTYEELVSQHDVDIVYIATFHPMHEEHVKLCCRAGKHILCEKPFAINAAQARRMVREVSKANVFCMEAIWTRFFPAFQEAADVVHSGKIGQVKSVFADFGFPYPPDATKAHFQPKMCGGALLDIGCYPLNASSFFLGYQPSATPPLPQGAALEASLEPDNSSKTGRPLASLVAVKATGSCDLGVDVVGSVALKYRYRGNSAHPGVCNEAVATVAYGWTGAMPERTTIVGESGRVTLESPAHCPTRVRIETSTGGRGAFEEVVKDHPLPARHSDYTGKDDLFFPNSEGLAYEASAVMQCIREGAKESTTMPLDETITVLDTMDQIRRQLGVRYSEDRPKVGLLPCTIQ